MKILLIGATGPLGRQVLEQGFARGHELTCLVRDPSAMEGNDRQPRIIKGDVLDVPSIDTAMAGQEAVICSLGVGITFRHVTLLSDGTRHLLDSMERHGVRRIIVVTGVGAGDSRGHGGFLYDKLMEPTLLRTIYEDKDRQEEVLRQSRAEWIGVRPGFMTHGAATGKYRVLLDLTGVTAGKISRADVANFLLKQLSSDDYVRKFPLLTY
jgi:putative NADH-flavin reductase